MKNKIFISIFILLSFFFINNVKADTTRTVTFDYDGTYSSYWVDENTLRITNTMINYMNNNYPDSRYIISSFSNYVNNNNQENLITLTFFTPESERGRYFLTTYSRSGYSYSLKINYTDTYEGVMQNGYLTQASNLKLYRGLNNGPIQCLKTDTNEECIDKLNQITTATYQTYGSAVSQDLGSYINSHNSTNLYSMCASSTRPSNCPSNFYTFNLRMILYSSFDIPITALENTDYFTTLKFKYGDNVITSNKGDKFYTYYDMVNIPIIPDNTISDFGSNSFGVKSNNIEIINSLGNSVNCVKDREFDNNGYCTFYYDDFGENDESDILNSNFDITFSFDDDNSHFPLITGKYYVFTYRTIADINIIPTLAMAYSGNTTIPLVIDDIKIINNGLNKDYQLILHTNNIDINNSLDILKIFNVPVKSYTGNINDFKLGVYNSYKYTQYDTMPTQQDLTNDLNNNSLNTINLGTTDNFFSKFSVNDHGLSTFITAPIRLFQALRNTTCETIILPVPHLGNMQLPCISSIFQQNLPDLFNIYQLIMSGIICYYIGLNYFRIIKNAFNPEDDRIEVQDL